MIERNGLSLGGPPSSFALQGMEPYSPVMVTTTVLDTPSEVWLGKASSHKEPSATCPTVRTPRKTSRNWAPLGGLVVLSALACCVVSCLTARLDAASTRAAPFVSADCEHSQLSVPLFVQLHLGAQVHARLRNLRCQQEQEVEPQPTESTNAPPADCRVHLGAVQRFHLGAQVPPYPRNPVTSRPTLHRKSLHPSLVSLHPLIGYPIACHRFLACCVSASALLLGTATCDNVSPEGARGNEAPVGGACVLRHDACRMFAMAWAAPVAAACLCRRRTLRNVACAVCSRFAAWRFAWSHGAWIVV